MTMSTRPDLALLQDRVRQIVKKAYNAESLHTRTPKNIREELENVFSLERGTLEAIEYKKPLKKCIDAALNDVTADSDKTPVKASAKRKRPSERSSNEKFKSADTVPTSDMEADDKVPSQVGPPAPKRAKVHSPGEATPKRASKPKRKVIEDSDPEEDAKLQATSSRETSAPPPKAEASDSEMSILIDEEPKPKKKRQTKEKSGSKSSTITKLKSASAKSGSSTGGKDEDTIKRLKALVVACGVRKNWASFFKSKGAEGSSRQQIKALEGLLASLGMTGRKSLEQARAIKEKRELAQELEDVQEFNEKMNQKPKRLASKSSKSRAESDSSEDEDVAEPTRANKKGKHQRHTSEEEAGSSIEDDVSTTKPQPKSRNARQSIMAFLGDSSDSD